MIGTRQLESRITISGVCVWPGLDLPRLAQAWGIHPAASRRLSVCQRSRCAVETVVPNYAASTRFAATSCSQQVPDETWACAPQS